MQGTPVFKTNPLNPRCISPHFHVFVFAIANKNQTFHDENSHIYLCCPTNLDFGLKEASHSPIQFNHAGPPKTKFFAFTLKILPKTLWGRKATRRNGTERSRSTLVVQ